MKSPYVQIGLLGLFMTGSNLLLGLTPPCHSVVLKVALVYLTSNATAAIVWYFIKKNLRAK
jgi:hypothetical protein